MTATRKMGRSEAEEEEEEKEEQVEGKRALYYPRRPRQDAGSLIKSMIRWFRKIQVMNWKCLR